MYMVIVVFKHISIIYTYFTYTEHAVSALLKLKCRV